MNFPKWTPPESEGEEQTMQESGAHFRAGGNEGLGREWGAAVPPLTRALAGGVNHL